MQISTSTGRSKYRKSYKNVVLNKGTDTISYFHFLNPHSSVISIFLLNPLTKQPPPPYYTFFRVICFLWLTHSPSLCYPVLKKFSHWV